MDRGSYFSISPLSLYSRLGSELAPTVVDVREVAEFDADDSMIPGAIRRPPAAIDDWRHELGGGRAVVAYCADGREASQRTAAVLRAGGADAAYLETGISGWVRRGLPRRRRLAARTHRWITRERPKIDRIACPWLIRRFIDPAAEFLFVPTEQVFAIAAETAAVAFDIPGAEPFSHDGKLCSFDAFLKVYGIDDPALDGLALIVRGADTARLELTPQSPGLLAISLGLSAIFADDHAMLDRGMIVYDALYAWCRDCRGETHNWIPPALPM